MIPTVIAERTPRWERIFSPKLAEPISTTHRTDRPGTRGVCKPTIASVNPDGYWYRIASSPWNNACYSPANTFMSGDPYQGLLAVASRKCRRPSKSPRRQPRNLCLVDHGLLPDGLIVGSTVARLDQPRRR